MQENSTKSRNTEAFSVVFEPLNYSVRFEVFTAVRGMEVMMMMIWILAIHRLVG
jgi:hypothetical protein